MKIWIVEATEPLPMVDHSYRQLRCGILATNLVARGHQVVWWSSTFDHMKKRHRFEGPRFFEVRPGLYLNLLHGPGYEKNICLGRVQHNRILGRSFERMAYHEPEPDLVLAAWPIPELAEKAVAYGRALNIPVIADIQDQWPEVYLGAFPPPIRKPVRWALAYEFRRARRVFRSATAIIAVSETYLKWALDYAGRSKGEMDKVYPLGYSILEVNKPIETQARHLQAKYGIRPNGMVATFIGMFGSSYDLETLIKAARVLEDKGISNVQIILVGDGDKGPRLRRMANGLQNVIFTGWVDQREMLALMGISSVGLAAYTNHALQSLPNKPFEYMAAGLPILSSLRGELEALIRDEQIGLQYQAGRADLLAEKMLWFAANPDSRHEMGRRGCKLFEQRFDAEVIYPQLIQQIEQFPLRLKREGVPYRP